MQVVDSMLWMSFERHINAFRTTVLGLEPLRVGEGGWNHLNVMQVTQGCVCPSYSFDVYSSNSNVPWERA